MSQHERIYLDNAATSWPKPESVYQAADWYQREIGAPNGRSGYREAIESNRIIERARRAVAQLIGTDEIDQVVFTSSGTDSLNMAIYGLVRPGDHVVTTVCEHNSVLRPLRDLRERAGVSVSYVPCNAEGIVDADQVRRALRPETRLVAVVHGSNVTGALQPIERIGELVAGHDAFYMVDAAQTLGHELIDVGRTAIDLLAAPGHKGLLGPLGNGVLYIRPGVEQQLHPFRLGGTGTRSIEDRQPQDMPDKYEPGNHNLPGLAGLTAGVEFLLDRSVEQIHAHHKQLTARLLDGLCDIDGVTIHGPQTAEHRTSVVSITVEGYSPQEFAAAAEAARAVQCRAGLHCAPKMHESLGTTEGGGTIRFSLGWATTADEIDLALQTIAELASVPVS